MVWAIRTGWQRRKPKAGQRVREHRAYANKAKFLADKYAHGHEQRPNRKTKIDVWAQE